MTKNRPDIIRVSIRKLKDWFIATSDSLPGLYLTDRSYDSLYRVIPEGIALLYRVDKKQAVTVEPYEIANEKTNPSEVSYLAKAA